MRTHTDATFPPAWQRYINLTKQWVTVRPALSVDDARTVSDSALAAMRLLSTCYTEWVAAVLAAYVAARGTALSADEHEKGPRASAMRMVALRALRNGRGDAAVDKLFAARLKWLLANTTLTALDGSMRTVQVLNPDAIKAHSVATHMRLQNMLWPGAQVLMWYDEAQMLMEEAKIFMRLKEHHGTPAAEREPQDALYGLTTIMAQMTNETSAVHVLCGPWLQLSDRVRLPEHSSLHDRLTVVHHITHLGVADMWRSLNRHFDLGSDVPDDIRAQLAMLCGRPRWFFDSVWPALWKLLRTAASDSEPATAVGAVEFSKESLLCKIRDALAMSLGQCQRLAKKLVDEAWDGVREVRTAHKSMTMMCQELYAALKLNGGRVTVKKNAHGDAVRYALLALQPPGNMDDMCMWAEPLVANALEARGDRAVPITLTASSRLGLDSDSEDPILSLFQGALNSIVVCDFNLTTSVKGPLLEILTAWHVVRTSIIAAREGRLPTLGDVMEPLLAPDVELPAGVSSRTVLARRALPASALRTHKGATDFHAFAAGSMNADVVLYAMDSDAGVDVAFAVALNGSGDQSTNTVTGAGAAAAVVPVPVAAAAGAGAGAAAGVFTAASRAAARSATADATATGATRVAAARVAALALPRTQMGFQIKVRRDARLIDGLRAATPAWQYTTESEREALCGGAWSASMRSGAPLAKRAALTALAEKEPELFDRAMRVMLSATPYRGETVALAALLNRKYPTSLSPVLLCVATPTAFGHHICNILRDTCRQSNGLLQPVAHTTNGRFWLPHSVAQVSALLDAGRGTVPDFDDELRKQIDALPDRDEEYA
ncbi:MAG: hypothetical protein EOO65_02165 [Methanosarcinales archaeon]|nr:MAG: hypothetical protein EOO65_02165 [Methanosarcinales archaeon]